VTVLCIHLLGTSAQLTEWACQWTLVRVRAGHFWMALHSRMQYHSDW